MNNKIRFHLLNRKRDWNNQANKSCEYGNGARIVANSDGWQVLDGKEEIDFFLKNYNGDYDTVVDFGSGVGRLMEFSSLKFKEIIGVDISENSLSNVPPYLKSKNIWDDKKFFLIELTIDGNHLINLQDQSVSFIYSCMCIQHIAMKEVRELIYNEFARILKSNGQCSLQLWYKKDQPNNSEYDWWISDISEVENEFKNSGLKIKKIRKYPTQDIHGDWLFVDLVK